MSRRYLCHVTQHLGTFAIDSGSGGFLNVLVSYKGVLQHGWFDLPSGNLTQLWTIAIEIVSFPIKHGESFQFVM